jgi:hypothetical protein
VKVGLARGANSASFSCRVIVRYIVCNAIASFCVVFASFKVVYIKSIVLCSEVPDNTTSVAAGRLTVPVNVGLARGALSSSFALSEIGLGVPV